MTRTEILQQAEKCINGDRDHQYGNPENNFETIAKLWSIYLGFDMTGYDVAIMMVLFKTARIASGQIKDDNLIDICGYAACASECV